MTIYFVTILGLAGLGYLTAEKKKNYYLAAVFVSFVFLTSFRYAIGFDYFSYRNIYQNVAEWSFHDILRSYWYEPLFFVVCKLFSLTGLSFSFFLIGIDLFLAFSAVWFIGRYSKMPWASVYFYITLQFLAYNMNLIRQSLAICFFLFAYPFLKDKKIAPFALLIAIGGLFHNSLWFMAPFFFLLRIKFSWKTVLPLCVCALGAYVCFEPVFAIVQPFIPAKYAAYPGSYFWYASGYEYVIPSLLYFILLYLFRNKMAENTRAIYLNSALYNLLISLFITKHFILERFAVYPFTFSLLAIPEILAAYEQNAAVHCQYGKKYRSILFLFLLFGMGYFLFAAAKGFHNVYPYVSLLKRA